MNNSNFIKNFKVIHSYLLYGFKEEHNNGNVIIKKDNLSIKFDDYFVYVNVGTENKKFDYDDCKIHDYVQSILMIN